MNYSVLINMILKSEGLSGENASARRKELEKLSDYELNKLLSNNDTFQQTPLGAFRSLEKAETYNGAVLSVGGGG